MEEESRYQAERLNDIRTGKMDEAKKLPVTIPDIAQEYYDYVASCV
jgi:hypothetical protein